MARGLAPRRRPARTQIRGRAADGIAGEARPTYRCVPIFLAAKCFSDARNPSALETLPFTLEQRLKALARFELPFFYETRDSESVQCVRDVRCEAVRAVTWCWPKAVSTKEWLEERARCDEDGYVRYAAIRELARGWKNDPEALPWLKERARCDDHGYVRQAAVQGVARGWKDDPDTLLWLKECACSDKDGNMRQAAVRELARGWKDNPDTLSWLKECARNGGHQNARQAAVHELARGWKDDLEVQSLMTKASGA